MENSNFTNIKTGSSEKILIFLLNKENTAFEFSSKQWEITKDLNQATLFIQQLPKITILKYKINGIYKNHTVRNSNLQITLKFLHNILSHDKSVATPILNKSLINFKDNNKFWDKSHSLINHLNKSFLTSKNIIHFCQCFFDLKDFLGFKTIHLFIHEKGNNKAQHVQITESDFSHSSQPVQEFTTLFQAIKKSKNRSFGQASLKASNYSIIGTCLAHEMSLTNHNLIFLVSKNDFLPQELKDIEFFNSFIKPTSFYMNLLLSKELNNKNEEINRYLYKIISSHLDLNKDLKEPYIQDIEKIIDSIQKSNFNLVDVNHQERIILLGELLNTLRHELSNPLFGLQLANELLSLEELSEEQEIFIGEMGKAINRSQSIIRSFSDIYTERPKFEQVELIHLINEIFTLTKSETRSIPKTILINNKNPDASNDKIIIDTNQTWLAQILFNLIINSAQAINLETTQSPHIIVSIETMQQTTEITVSDNGPGLKNNQNENVFNPFYTTKAQGTGLGLSITKSLVQKLNGEIKNIPSDNGAKFLIRLPNETSNH